MTSTSNTSGKSSKADSTSDALAPTGIGRVMPLSQIVAVDVPSQSRPNSSVKFPLRSNSTDDWSLVTAAAASPETVKSPGSPLANSTNSCVFRRCTSTNAGDRAGFTTPDGVSRNDSNASWNRALYCAAVKFVESAAVASAPLYVAVKVLDGPGVNEIVATGADLPLTSSVTLTDAKVPSGGSTRNKGRSPASAKDWNVTRHRRASFPSGGACCRISTETRTSVTLDASSNARLKASAVAFAGICIVCVASAPNRTPMVPRSPRLALFAIRA